MDNRNKDEKPEEFGEEINGTKRSFADVDGEGSGEANKTIFIGNLPWEINEDEISEFFSKFGTVTSIKMVKDHQTGRSKGFGFVTFFYKVRSSSLSAFRCCCSVVN